MIEQEEKQMQLKRIENYSHALYLVVIERYKVLPLISTLSAALVGLVIQNTELIKIRSLALISLIILLILIPLSVFAILYQLESDIKNIADRIENVSQPGKNPITNTNFISIFPWIIFFFFSIAIILAILSFFDLR